LAEFLLYIQHNDGMAGEKLIDMFDVERSNLNYIINYDVIFS